MLKRAKTLIKFQKKVVPGEKQDSDSEPTQEEDVDNKQGEGEAASKGDSSENEEGGTKRNFAEMEEDYSLMHPNDRPRRTKYLNKQRTLIFASRGITSRNRHLLKDLRDLLPHSKKEAKFSEKRMLWAINEICEMRACNNCIYFESRKKYMYMWIARAPYGPSIKFFVQNVHTMSELKLTGNCLKGSRPMLVFDAEFDTSIEKKVMKELFIQAFGTPSGHPKSKPFCDHAFTFTWCDGRIWFRNFQIVYDADAALTSKADPIMVEIGPRFCLQPVRIISSSFKGQTLWMNKDWTTPTDKSIARKRAQRRQYIDKRRELNKKRRRMEKLEDEEIHDPLANVFLEAEGDDDKELEISSDNEELD